MTAHSDRSGQPGRTLHVGQLNTPRADKAVAAFEGIFERQFYTNHGPLVAEFEARIADYLGVRHVICTTNATMGLMLAARSLGLEGDVVIPAFTFPATAQALSFANLNPVFCDVDAARHTVTVETVEAALTPATSAIMGVHVWGRSCDIDGLQRLAEARGIKLLFDAAHAFGCTYNGRRIGGFGACEVFSFHATKVLNCAEGGCVTTNDDAVAAAVRTAANFHEQHTFAQVPLRVNAKMSEAQAAMGLLSLEDLDANIASNRRRYERYREALRDVPGLGFCDHAGTEDSNYQYVVCEVDEAAFGMSRNRLMTALQGEGVHARRYFYPCLHEAYPYAEGAWRLPVTERLCASVIQFPSGGDVSDADIDRVCNAVRKARAAGGATD